MTDRLHVFVEGRVQGVGFRYSACFEAERRGLCGWVRNTHDGRVEAEFEGARDQLDAMLRWCHQGPRGAQVQHVDAQWESGEPKYQTFGIRY
jgi:acylphosphatase